MQVQVQVREREHEIIVSASLCASSCAYLCMRECASTCKRAIDVCKDESTFESEGVSKRFQVQE